MMKKIGTTLFQSGVCNLYGHMTPPPPHSSSDVDVVKKYIIMYILISSRPPTGKIPLI